jgi:hypothetical protein
VAFGLLRAIANSIMTNNTRMGSCGKIATNARMSNQGLPTNAAAERKNQILIVQLTISFYFAQDFIT